MSPAIRSAALTLFLVTGAFGCNRSAARGTALTADANPTTDAPMTPPADASSRPTANAETSAAPQATGAAAAPATPVIATASADAEPPLKDTDGKLLPQTEDKPSLASPVFKKRIEQLVRAIEKDDPALARSFFFPVEAYEVVKAIKQPAKDWNRRLYRAFERSVHDYHKKLGKHAEGTKLVRLDVNEERAKWMEPGREGNKLGYFRVTRSQLVVEDGSGKQKKLDLSSMISWRGEWYVVHLHGFK